MSAKACTVSVIGPTGIRRSVDVTAESLYEAAILGFSLLKKDEWGDPMPPGTELEIQVKAPATSHFVTLAQMKRWVDGIAVSPEETLKKRRLKQLLAT